MTPLRQRAETPAADKALNRALQAISMLEALGRGDHLKTIEERAREARERRT
ncbi:MAG TPA: hypothetical protein VKA19_13055 [Alphaproteobacteria bacterium]|nr:hypothetical protein [Alphaproteobacteria bacterium]